MIFVLVIFYAVALNYKERRFAKTKDKEKICEFTGGNDHVYQRNRNNTTGEYQRESSA